MVESIMIDENGWWQRDPISDEECILICLKNAPCGTNKKQVARLIDEIQNKNLRKTESSS